MAEHAQGAAGERFPWWPLMIGGLIVALTVLGLYALTPIDSRASMLRSVGGALTGLVAAGVAALSAWLTHQLRGETNEQGHTLATIQKQTNGVLDARIQEGVTQALTSAGLVVPAQAGYDRPAPVAPVVDLSSGSTVEPASVEDDSALALPDTTAG